MAFWLQEQRAKVEKIEHKDNYTVAKISTSRKDMKNQGKYLYSNWSFVRFVGKAHTTMMEDVKDGDIVVLKSAIVSKEAYTDSEGKKAYPKSEQVVVFNCELYRAGMKQSEGSQEEAELPSEDDIPF